MFIKIENLNLKVKDRSKPIIKDINLAVNKGEFVVIIGHNGSGKSSLFKILAGQRKASSGKVLLNNKDVNKSSDKDFAKMILRLSQNPDEMFALDFTLEENIQLWQERAGLFDQKQQEITFINKDFTNSRDQLMKNLSGGEKQEILLSFIMSFPPEILLLDEHTSALDAKAAKKLMQITNQVIRKKELTTLMITHNIEDALAYGDRVIIMSEGQVVFEAKNSDVDKQIIQKYL